GPHSPAAPAFGDGIFQGEQRRLGEAGFSERRRGVILGRGRRIEQVPYVAADQRLEPRRAPIQRLAEKRPLPVGRCPGSDLLNTLAREQESRRGRLSRRRAAARKRGR